MYQKAKKLTIILIFVFFLPVTTYSQSWHSVLLIAASKGDIPTVKDLLVFGADINVKDNNGLRPLHIAVNKSNSEMIEFLINNRANINAKNKNGLTALHYAVYHHQKDIISMLISKGANVNSRGNVRGSTPLMLAAEKGNVKLIELLLENGAKINAVDQFEETALARAYRMEKLKAATLLESRGAIRKPDRNVYSYSEKDLKVIPKVAIPGWTADDDDDGLDDEENEALEEQFEAE